GGCSNFSKNSQENLIAVVNTQEIKKSKTYKNLEEEIDNLKKDIQEKIKEVEKLNNLKKSGDPKNLEYFLRTNLEEKKEKIYKEFQEKLEKTIYYTANQEKIGLVVSHASLPYGGKDITQKVIENLDNNKFDNTPLFNSVEIVSYLANPVDSKTIQKILEQLYQEKGIYVVLDKKEIFLGGFDLNAKLLETHKKQTKSNNNTK
ncbi:MAG: hypothetical protein ACK4ZM_02015, partial [bacterium]